MYSGMIIFSKHSGALIGAHQKIDKVAHRRLMERVTDEYAFPTIKEVLHFEGLNGPDGIKRKSPGKDEPWHYIDPFDESDTQLTDMLQDHHHRLSEALKKSDNIRAAFEAAWLAHAMVDGLTPAHHFPYEEELSKLRGGEGLETRTNFRKKLIMPGETTSQKVKNNWKMWGGGGLYTTHATFEMGVATLIKPLTFSDIQITRKEIEAVRAMGIAEFFKRSAREVGVLDMYERFSKKGWTPKIAYDVRHKLGPTIIKTVTLAWCSALEPDKLKDDHANHRRKTRRQAV